MSELEQYDYELPKELVAQAPVHCRSDARMLVVDRANDTLLHRYVRDLPDLLCKDDCLVVNDTRVVAARLVGYRTETGGHWEGLFLQRDASGHWLLMCKTRGKLTVGETITITGDGSKSDLLLRLLAKQSDGTWIAEPDSNEETFELLERVGRVPLPPYIRKGEMVSGDRTRYQTVYAQEPGSVAAPTAGLHFTEPLLEQIAERGIDLCRITLHVGLGTFKPIASENLADHEMHSEWGNIDAETVEKISECRRRGGRVVAVGTTSVRVLETAAADGTLRPFSGQTDLFIRPPYKFKAIDAMMTNFHLPQTTLLVLVRTFGGDALIRRAYEEAVREQYRFYSYGDSMLILP
jgi:S-adenosylmethionine:tRNA ribosyltransferase-isomerase